MTRAARRGTVVATCVVVAVTWLAGCGGPGPGGDDRRFTVLAAASLTEPFTVLAKRFEAQH
ncbi:MAG: molybdate ABC transporter substrate-binding protein, partial [Nocardioidaceae bacterium]